MTVYRTLRAACDETTPIGEVLDGVLTRFRDSLEAEGRQPDPAKPPEVTIRRNVNDPSGLVWVTVYGPTAPLSERTTP